MHKISNTFGSRMPATFGISRSQHQDAPQQPQPLRRPPASANVAPPNYSEYSAVNLSFNIPFASSLPGPEPEEILHASPGAVQRWTFPVGTPDDTPIYKLPVHVQNEERLRGLCRYISDSSGGRIEALVTSSEPKTPQALQQKSVGITTNVCISGDNDVVHKMRAKVLNETPILMVQL